MSTQHTPGPWTLKDYGYKYIVHKPGDGYITREVCRMDGSTMAAFNQEANARLIAAAPELLEALQAVIAEHEDGYGLKCVEQVKAAIAKATGEQK